MAANGDARAGGVPRPTNPMVTPLLTDLYQFTMAYAYWKAGKHLDRAVFDLYFRKNPFGGEFTIFGGLEECIRFIANFKFTEEEIKFLKSVMPTCEDGFFEYLSSIDCSDVEIYAIPEGYVVFPKVPLMRIEGPVAVIQLLETPFLSLVNYASLVTTNAARRRLIAGKSKNLLEFGLRRAQGPDGGISASRYSYMGGFDATSNVAAGRLFGIPIRGTHSHAFVSSFMGLDEITDKALTSSDGSSKCENFVSLVQKCLIKIQDSSSLRGTFGETSQSELAAFTSYALAFPSSFLALVDTYDINGRELHFSMVDGDFKKFEGKWSIRSGPRSSSAILLYEVNVIPRFNFPAIFLERIIRSDLPVNLRALACRAEKIYLENKKCGSRKFSAVGLKPSSTSSQLKFQSTIIKTTPNKFKEALPTSGVSSVLPSPSSELIGKWGVYGNTCRIDRPCVVDEIHLRRVDGLLEHEGAHWCVYASITVKAPVREVWNVLTAYENLPEFVPNLAISRIVLRDNNKVRIMQEGCKGLLYMVLHARVVMDLREKLEEEISFEQVEGDFYSFKGTWRFEQLGDQHTLLKYMVETKMHKDTFLSESILEEIIYEDLPSNLCAIRDYIEKAGAEGSNSTTHSIAPTHPDIDHAENSQSEKESASCSFSSTKQRPKVPGLQKDIEVLKSELENFIAKYGQDGFMPKRKHLRSLGSVDIEKAITRMGGFRKIASTMNLSLSYKNRKPRGYWDNLENLQEEPGMDPSYMPSRKSFERAGRYDIARALEKWGGLQEVSRLLSLELRRPRRQADSDERLSEAPTGSGMSKKQGMKPDKANMSPDAHKWLLKLKDLDVNWVEY